MKPVVRMTAAKGLLRLQTRVYLDIRVENESEVRHLIEDGIRRIATHSPYQTNGRTLFVESEMEYVEAFSVDAVNVRIVDQPLIRRHGVLRFWNTVSRAYPDARRCGLFKWIRRALRFPDVVINLGGAKIDEPSRYDYLCSVVAHEFAHVWGCGDQYKLRNEQKRKPDVADGDLMYRTGASQRMQPYHIARLYAFAKKGKLPLRKIV